MAAIVCLPRQFHIGVIAAASPAEARAARWPFIAYLVLTTLAAVPITLAGLTVMPAGSVPELFVLELPLDAGAEGLAVLVFLGGFAAATGMVVVGLVAFATMAQFAPVLLLAMRRRTGDARAAIAGLGTGLVLWAALLLLPTLGWLGTPDLTRGVVFSLGGNVLAHALVAARRLRTVPADAYAGEVAARLVTIGALADMAATSRRATATASSRRSATRRRGARRAICSGPRRRTSMSASTIVTPSAS